MVLSTAPIMPATCEPCPLSSFQLDVYHTSLTPPLMFPAKSGWDALMPVSITPTSTSNPVPPKGQTDSASILLIPHGKTSVGWGGLFLLFDLAFLPLSVASRAS